ncbi:MAG: glycosyltransferase [Acidobacteria bacterium]|nr:glycosyltransferase [Acidobacteriota bacterium]
MHARYDLSVVISSYNRNNTVIETVESVFRSDVEGLTGVEVIVIDDGSPNPVDSALSQIVSIPFKFDLRLLTQPNPRNRRDQEPGVLQKAVLKLCFSLTTISS